MDKRLTLASRQPLDLMITDWMMPEMSGPELIASIRELPEKQGLPIILLTANADERARIEGVDTGADAFLEQTFSKSRTAGYGKESTLSQSTGGRA